MESTTIFLAQLWGPAVLAMGVGVYVNRRYYQRIYRTVEKEPLALLLFGLAGMAAGITHIQAHNLWNSLPEIVVTVFGWLLLVKAAIFLIEPNIADRWGDKIATTKLIPIVSVVAVVLGAYLSWVGYFMA